MQQLGHTRSACRHDHLVLTTDTFVRALLPGMKGATAIVHVGPVVGANFTQYTAEFEPGGQLGYPKGERFVYVLEGALSVGSEQLGAGSYVYLPEDESTPVIAQTAARAAVIEKSYQQTNFTDRPLMFTGREDDIAAKPLAGDDALQVRTLIPEEPAFDFAVNTMTYQPGASLPMVEIHVMEHGLLMLEGGGIYRLADEWYPVKAGDFIWMAPFCPQWFGALGKTPAKYLIYKDWNRHPLA